ncbi:MAG TPA: hypothetical protein VFX30_02220 [bacterium]|nr:hypothetical protein [bacterium]
MTITKPIRAPIAVLLAAVALVAECSSPGAPPRPPAEIPGLVAFPQSVEIDVSTISSGAVPAALSTPKAAVGAGGEFSSAITTGADLIRTIYKVFVEIGLRPLTRVQAPVDPTVTRFEATVTEGATPGDFKIDFADFDLDGDGASEGCTGCTCPTGCTGVSCPASAPLESLKPVCYRVWFREEGGSSFTRLMAGVFERLAVADDAATPEDENNPGAGRFRRFGFNFGDVSSDFASFYDFLDPDDPLNRSSEVFLKTVTEDPGGAITTFNHLDAVQIGDAPQKTVRVTAGAASSPPNEVFKYRGGFREDEDFFSGVIQNPSELLEFCARISTGDAAEDPGACDALGISVVPLPFLNFASEDDVAVPAGFPETPTF